MSRHDAQADTKRDALALYRAVLNDDDEARDVILSHTRCHGCLTIHAVLLGLVLGMDGPDDVELTASSWRASETYRAEIDAVLADMQDGMT